MVAVVAAPLVVKSPAASMSAPAPVEAMLPPAIVSPPVGVSVPAPMVTLPPLTVSGPMRSVRLLRSKTPDESTVTIDELAIWLPMISRAAPPLTSRFPAMATTPALASSSVPAVWVVVAE